MKSMLLLMATGLMAFGLNASPQAAAGQVAPAAQAGGRNCPQCSCRNQNAGARCPMASGQAGRGMGMGMGMGNRSARGQRRGMCGGRGANTPQQQTAPAPAK